MAKQGFRKWKPSQKTVEIIEAVNEVQRMLRKDDFWSASLRQVYYQLVSDEMKVIPNTPESYARLQDIVSKARYAGLVDWDFITDRGRPVKAPSEYRDLAHLLEAAIYSYELDYWKEQMIRPVVMVEKQALESVMQKAVTGWHVRLLVNKGYSSSSALYVFAQWVRKVIMDNGQKVRVLYLGDHDPSGLDMVRDVQDRVMEFLEPADEEELDLVGETPDDWYDRIFDQEYFAVQHVALKRDQVNQFNLQPDPAKVTDSRAKEYIKLHGSKSWELDALKPRVLVQMVEQAIKATISNRRLFDMVKKREKTEIKELEKFAQERSK